MAACPSALRCSWVVSWTCTFSSSLHVSVYYSLRVGTARESEQDSCRRGGVNLYPCARRAFACTQQTVVQFLQCAGKSLYYSGASDECALALDVGVDDGQCRHVDDPPDCRRRREDMRRLRHAEQDRTERESASSSALEQIERDVRRVKRRHDQQIRIARKARVRENAIAH